MRTLLVLVALAFCVSPVSAETRFEARASQIDDGDTPLIDVRVHGIDAPERTQQCERGGACYDCGADATKAMKELVYRKQATYVVRDVDKYGRVVASIYVKGQDVALEMVRRGLVIVYRQYLPDPDMTAEYLAVEKEAREARRGIWAGKFIEPWKWRRGKRLEGCE